MSSLTGVAYHLAAYGKSGDVLSYVQVGVLAASIFAVIQSVPPRISPAEFLLVQDPWPAHHPALERDADLPADDRLSGPEERRLFARLDRSVLCRDARRADRRALRHQCASPHSRAPTGCAVGTANLPDRHRRQCRRLRQPLRALDARHQHRRLPLPHAGRRLCAGRGTRRHSRSRSRRSDRKRPQARAGRDFRADAVVGDRDHRSLRRKLCIAAGGDPSRPRAGAAQVRASPSFDARPGRQPATDAAAADTPRDHREARLRSDRRGRRSDRDNAAADCGRHPDQARQPGPDLLCAAALRLQSAAVPHHQVPHHVARSTMAR